jgi:hypothetical protein
MNLASKSLLTALAAAALFASLATSASARNFSLSNRNIRMVWSEVRPLEFVTEVGTIRCRVTLEGSFHCATISKVAEALLGYLSRGTVEPATCNDSGGNSVQAQIRQETLPWHIRYVSFSGTLPRVRIRDRAIGMGFRLVNVPIIGNCLYRVNVDSILSGPSGGTIDEGNTFLAPDESTEANSETFGCPRGRFRSQAVPVLLLGTTNGIRVRLT